MKPFQCNACRLELINFIEARTGGGSRGKLLDFIQREASIVGHLAARGSIAKNKIKLLESRQKAAQRGRRGGVAAIEFRSVVKQRNKIHRMGSLKRCPLTVD